MNKKWVVKEANPLLSGVFAQRLQISPLLAQILLNRGLFSLPEAAQFLYGDLSCLFDPFLLRDMDRAVERVRQAVRRGEKILVYGDYDADGITGTALLVHALGQLGAAAEFYIPRRLHEGYGLHLEPVQKAHAQGFTLVITVDCGISGVEAANWAKHNRGPDLIITDHHQAPDRLPAALAVLNPKRSDCPYPFKELAGVGVALKLAQALFREVPAPDRPAWKDYLDLVCLGTVADVVPLLGENRLLVKHGLPSLAGTKRPGLKALLAAAGCPEDQLTTREISFGLAPRLNAVGRMGDAGRAVRLLLCPDAAEAQAITAGLEEINRQRQAVEQTVFDEALRILEDDPQRKESRVIVLANETFHPGVTGIVASRLAEIFYRPVMLVALAGTRGKGSGRSIPGFHLYTALSACRQHLLAYGGHAQAAGFTIETGRLEEFATALNEYARQNFPDDLFVPRLELDTVTSLAEITGQLINEFNLLIPFGAGNPEPVLGCLGATILRRREVGREGNHLKLFVKENGAFLDSIGFRLAGPAAAQITAGKTAHLAFTPVLDQYNGQTRVQLELKDIRPAEAGAAPSPEGGLPPAGPETGAAGLPLKRPEIAGRPALAPGSAAFAQTAAARSLASAPASPEGGLPPAGLEAGALKEPQAGAARSPNGAPPGSVSAAGRAPDGVPDRGEELLASSLPELAGSWFAAYARFPGGIFLPPPAAYFTAAGPPQPESGGSLDHPGRLENRPGGAQGNVPDDIPAGAPGGLDRLKITDLRNTPGKLRQLAGFCTGGRRTVVLTGCPYQTAALAARLNGTGFPAAFYHPLWPDRGELHRFREGRLNTLVTTAGGLRLPSLSAELANGVEQLIVAHLPFSRREWTQILHSAAGAGVKEILLLFDAADRREMEHHLASLAPDRECLAYLYVLLRHGQAKHKSIPYTPPELAAAIRRAGLFWAGEHTVQIALAVFFELGLLKKDREMYLTPAPAQKLNVRNSSTYTWGEKARRQTAQWYANALAAPVQELLTGFSGEMSPPDANLEPGCDP